MPAMIASFGSFAVKRFGYKQMNIMAVEHRVLAEDNVLIPCDQVLPKYFSSQKTNAPWS